MENYLYQCQYCGKEYKPNRRHKQIFCSNSCRTNSHIRNKKLKLPLPTNNTSEVDKPIKIEKMSWAGFGNAAAGTIAVNVATNLFTSEENKPVTKKDLSKLINTLKGRYFPIKNAPIREDGAKPYYDIQTQSYVYFKN